MKSLKMFYAASLLLAALLVPSIQAQAQDRPARDGKHRAGAAGDRIQHLTEQLSLTADQQAKVKAIYAEQATAMKELANDTSLSEQDRRSKRMELMRGANAKVRAVLTPEQQTKFDQMSPGRNEGGRKGKKKSAE